MSDDVWRRRSHDDDEDDFGPPLFGDEPTSQVPESSTGEGLSFGSGDTGSLPHWSEPPTGEMPRTLSVPEHPDPTDDLDVWTSFSADAPVWSDDPAPTGELAEVAVTGTVAETPPIVDPFNDFTAPAVIDDSAAVPRREPGRITIGTDPTDDRMGRPMPKGRSRSGRDDPGNRSRPPVRTTPGARSAPGGTTSRDMPTAVAVGLLIAAVFTGALLAKPWLALIIIVAVVGLASVEFFDKVSEKGYRPATVAGIVACASAPIATYFYGESAIPLVMFLALAAGCMTFISSTSLDSSPMPNMAITTLGVTWIGIMGAFGSLILSFSNFPGARDIGTDTLFLLALCVVANDVGALFVGSAAGKTPLRHWISPNKTFEGFVGGTVMTILAMVVVGVADKSTTWHSTKDLVILGIVVSITAPLGDFTESMFKRNLDVKDFGNLIKGHGGVLDRFDGFLFTLPAVYYLLVVLQPWATV